MTLNVTTSYLPHPSSYVAAQDSHPSQPGGAEERGGAERDAHRRRVVDLGQRPRWVGCQRLPVHGSGVRVGGPALEGRSVRRGAVEAQRLVAEARHVVARDVPPRARGLLVMSYPCK